MRSGSQDKKRSFHQAGGIDRRQCTIYFNIAKAPLLVDTNVESRARWCAGTQQLLLLGLQIHSHSHNAMKAIAYSKIERSLDTVTVTSRFQHGCHWLEQMQCATTHSRTWSCLATNNEW